MRRVLIAIASVIGAAIGVLWFLYIGTLTLTALVMTGILLMSFGFIARGSSGDAMSLILAGIAFLAVAGFLKVVLAAAIRPWR
jgi:hypothetical protein